MKKSGKPARQNELTMRKPGITIALIMVAALAASGCALINERAAALPQYGLQNTPAATSAGDAQASPAKRGAYRLDSGDRLRIIVFGQRELSGEYAIDSAGTIAMPLIGLIRARGLTAAEFQNRITSQLGATFLRDPSVIVEVINYRPFFILGEVNNAGQYPYITGLTVQTAVAIAGGYTYRAEQDYAEVTRQHEGRIIHGEATPNTPIYPGDTINIVERYF